MPEITLELVQQRQAELAAMIERLTRAKTAPIELPAATIHLQAGEHYAGLVLNADGSVRYHLVLMAARPEGDLDWEDATSWASEVGGELPTRQEQALLYANCKPHLKPVWHWSSETHASDSSYAWFCDFSYGSQGNYRESAEGAAVAVRRVTP